MTIFTKHDIVYEVINKSMYKLKTAKSLFKTLFLREFFMKIL